MRSRLLAILLLPMLGPFFPAFAQNAPDDPCRGQGNRTCAVMREARDLFGLPSAEARVSAGEEIRRAFFIGGWGDPIVAVEYRRAPGHEPTLSIHGGRDARGAGGDSVSSAAVPLAEWERLGAAGRLFDRALAPPAAGGGPGEILVCADGYSLLVETTDPSALAPGDRLRRRVASSCPDNPAYIYAQELAASAVRLLPACAGLEPRGPGNEAALLRDCTTLAGDRMAAAEVHNRLGELRRAPDRMAGLFARDVRLDWHGERIAPGDAAAALAGHFYPRRLVGETGRRVRAEGVLSRITREGSGDEVHWEAPVTLIFADPPSQSWQIAQVRVGPLARVARPLSPRLRP